MTETLQRILSELEAFGEKNDRAVADRSRCMLNITRDTGAFLSVLVRATNAKRILELGTSNGYSTLWLADAAHAIGGRVTTVELSKFKIELAAENFKRSGVAQVITQIHGEAGAFLASQTDASFDLIFLDSKREAYPNWWPDVRRVIREGGLLVADNATSHPEELAPFVTLAKADTGFTSSLVPVGKGEFLATRSSQ